VRQSSVGPAEYVRTQKAWSFFIDRGYWLLAQHRSPQDRVNLRRVLVGRRLHLFHPTITSKGANPFIYNTVVLGTGSNIQCGRALAIADAVTMDTNMVGCEANAEVATPEPSTVSLTLLLGVAGLIRLGTAKQVRVVEWSVLRLMAAFE
jgi:hypothetical protein